MIEHVLNRRLESDIRALDLADVRVRETGAAAEADDGKSRRNVSNVGANDHKKTLTLYHHHGHHTTTADANDELQFLATTLPSQSSFPLVMKWLSLQLPEFGGRVLVVCRIGRRVVGVCRVCRIRLCKVTVTRRTRRWSVMSHVAENGR